MQAPSAGSGAEPRRAVYLLTTGTRERLTRARRAWCVSTFNGRRGDWVPPCF